MMRAQSRAAMDEMAGRTVGNHRAARFLRGLRCCRRRNPYDETGEGPLQIDVWR